MKKAMTVLGVALVLPVFIAAVGSVPVAARLSGIKVGAPVKHGNLTVFPLEGSSNHTVNYLTLDKAIKRGYVEVEEKDGGDVNTVRVRNTSDRYVFGLAGEIVTGAKQNRMLQRDIIMPPKSKWLNLSVYCVEQGRWHGESMEFSSKSQIVTGGLRGKAAQYNDQSEVWAEVSRNNHELGIVTGSDRFDAVYDDEEIQEKVAGYKRALETKVPELSIKAVGVAVAIGDRLVCVDLFASRKLFKAMWPRLLESYSVDALRATASGKMTASDVRAFLDDGAAAELTQQPALGTGQLYRLEADELTGSSLVWGGQVVHLDLFPEDEGDSEPLELNIRRGDFQR